MSGWPFNFAEGTIILGGDFNVALEPLLDLSQWFSQFSFSYLHWFKWCLEKSRRINIWRFQHHNTRRLYFLLASSPVLLEDLLLHCASCISRPSSRDLHLTYHNFTPHADHNDPFSHKTSQPSQALLLEWKSHTRWPTKICIARWPLYLFITNDTTESRSLFIWKVHKCFIRGSLIKMGAKQKWEYNKLFSAWCLRSSL